MATVTLKGNPVSLVGTELNVGDAAPDFSLRAVDGSDASLGTFPGTKIVVTVPSLDTSVCSLETKKFNDEAANLEGVTILVVSTDLPFAMKRWCGAEGVERVHCLSDHLKASMESYGVLIGGGLLERCLARAVFVVDAAGKIKHVEYVSEIANEPDYGAALDAAKA